MSTTFGLRRFQFRLLSIFLLVALVAFGLLWWRTCVEPFRRQRETMDLVARLGGSYEVEPALTWLRWFSPNDFRDVTMVNLADCEDPDAYISHIATLPALKILVVGGDTFTDNHLRTLLKAKSLQWLVSDCTDVSERAFEEAQLAIPGLRVHSSQRRAIAKYDHVETAHIAADESLACVDSDHFEVARRADAYGLPPIPVATSEQRLKQQITSVKYLVDLEELRWLDADLGSTALPDVTRLRQLQSFSLDGSNPTDSDLIHLTDLPNLKHLSLSSTPIADAGLAILSKRTALRTLNLSRTKVTNEGLIYLKTLSRLRQLFLDNTQVTDLGLLHLRALSQLEGLSLRSLRLTDDAVPNLIGLTKLKWLDLSDTNVTSAGCQHLKSFPDVEDLTLNGTRITDDGLLVLEGLAKLRQVSLLRTAVSEVAVGQLQRSRPLLHIAVTQRSQ